MLALAILAFSLVLGGLYLLLSRGVSSDWLSQRAQTAVVGALGADFDVTFAATRLSLDSEQNLALEADGLVMRDKRTGIERGRVNTVKLGLSAIRLLAGRMDVSRVEISGAVFDLTFTGDEGSDPLRPFRNPSGQLIGAPVVKSAFLYASQAFRKISESSNPKFHFNSVDAKLGAASAPELLKIQTLDINHLNGRDIEANGQISWRGSSLALNGSLAGKDSFRFNVSNLSVELGKRQNAVEPDGSPTQPLLQANAAFDLAGSLDGGAQSLRVNIDLPDLAINTGRNKMVNGTSAIHLELRSDADKIEILPSQLRFGANFAELSGAVAPETSEASRNYKFELVTSRATLRPLGSPEPAVAVSGQVRGTYDPQAKVANLDEIGLRTLSGEVFGKGTMTFLSTSPRSVLSFNIPRLSVSHAKQLWPVNVAVGARAWMFDHVFGGTIQDSTIELNIPEGRYGSGVVQPLLTADQLQATFNVRGARFDATGDLPPVRDAIGVVRVRGVNTDVRLESGTAYLENNQTAGISAGTLLIPYERGKTPIADLAVSISGDASALAAIAALDPVNAMRDAPFAAGDLSGFAEARVLAKFPLKKDNAKAETTWSSEITLKDVSIQKPFDGQILTGANGVVSANNAAIKLEADGSLNGIPAKIMLQQPLGAGGERRKLSVQLELSEKARAKLTPGLNDYVKGPVYVDLQAGSAASRQITADLTKAAISLDFAGWSKGAGVPAAATFSMSSDQGRTVLKDFELSGDSFSMRGTASLDKSGLASADMSNISLVRGDKISAKITRTKSGYAVKINGDSLDVRALVKKVTGSFDSAAKSIGSTSVSVAASISKVTGFNSEAMSGLQMTFAGQGSRVDSLEIKAKTNNGGDISVSNRQDSSQRQVQIQSEDAGSILRFFDYYDKMRGGSINISLASSGDGPMQGSIDARNFTLVNEPRMRSLVGGTPKSGGPSLKEAVKKDIDVSTVKFSRGFANISKSRNSLSLDDGVLRGDLIGLAFRGTAYDKAGNINLSGTFMPAYGLNRIFGEIPLLGLFLGNGDERGLIGITFKLSGKAKTPQLTVNPISVIAPGIFRQIFEFR